ncbi:peptide ABC transporter substrate-binding protein [Rossellomorea aquimaris]|uniref:peptide ABC transporter substrate-binding protein n=1 Tax=Rossellomorea aquimaris TaxID=189382 RepID=UPI0011E91F13|nr:peptide ABC transporter substrate-binding protein [Rossellomorea aquimaris]TYS83519.1 peptide ABC transporter substrate-binding protein [Rossellomorea aquimaris]
MRFNINFDNNYGFKNLNPATCQDTSTANVLHNIYKGLFIYKGNNLVKGVLKSYCFDNETNTYTFYLEDCFWSNQVPITSQDFVTSWMRIIKEKTCNTEFFKIIKNVESYLSGRVNENEIGIKLIDNRSFSVTLENSCPYFLHITASTPYLPVPEFINEAEIGFVGNGSYVIEQNNKDSLLLKSLENKKEINITCDSNEESIHYKFVNKEIDISDGIPFDYMDEYKREDLINYIPEFGTSFVQFNCSRLSLKERVEIDRAIDRKQLVSPFIQNKRTNNLVPWHLLNVDVNPTVRQTLTSSLSSKIKTITLLVNNVELYLKIARELKLQIENTSICNVEVVVADWEEFTKKLFEKDFDMALSGWIGDYFDPYSLLSIWYSDSTNNHSGFSNEKYDSLLTSSQNVRNTAKRYKALSLAEETLLNKRVIIPLYHYHLPLLIQDELKNTLSFSPLGIIDFNTIEYRREALANGTKE